MSIIGVTTMKTIKMGNGELKYTSSTSLVPDVSRLIGVSPHTLAHESMSLDEAINHVLDEAQSLGDCPCGLEYKQLAEWLLELKYRRQRDGD